MTSSLRNRIIALLSEAQPSAMVLPVVAPDTLGHDVLRWGRESGSHHYLLHVRDDVVVAWNVKADGGAGRPRGPLPHAEEVTAWIASVTEAELGLVEEGHPLAYVDRAPIAGLGFTGFAVAHPTLAVHAIAGSDTDHLLPARSFVVFPCHRCEIPVTADPAWARTQFAHLGWSDLARPLGPAVRNARFPKPGPKKKPKPRRPLRASDAATVANALRRDGDWIEVENWKGEVLRIAEGRVQRLSDGSGRPVAGIADAKRAVAEFLANDALTLEAGAKAVLVGDRLYSMLEAMSGEVVDDIEPVVVVERSTGDDVARLWVHQKPSDRVLDVAYVTLDPRVEDALLPQIVTGPYLHVLANGYWRGKIDAVRLHPRDAPDQVTTLAYR